MFSPYIWLPFVVLRCRALDGQSHRASDEEVDNVWNDPDCTRTRDTTDGIDWDVVRLELLTTAFPYHMPTIGAVVGRLEHVVEIDRASVVCPFGLISVLFFFVKYLIENDGSDLYHARVYFSLLESFTSTVHPHLLDRSSWPVKDSRLVSLRRDLLSLLPPAQDHPKTRPYIFVYDHEVAEIQALSQGASFCGKGQWGMEVHIHEWLLTSKHLTRDPAEADFFFVPAYSICMFEAGFFPLARLDEVYTSMVRKLPYFSKRHGRDHIFTFGSGMSANVFKSWRREIPESIFLTPETWLFNDLPDVKEPCFNTLKDIAIPGYLHRHEIRSLVSRARPLAEREHLGVFLGRTDPSRGPHPSSNGPDVRGILRRLYHEGKIFVAQDLAIPDMHAVMGNARFCFVPKGKSAWSLRFYEALFANCVPVVLSDHWELPFEEFLNRTSFTIKWPERHVGDELLDFLRNHTDDALERYMSEARRHRCWYVYPSVLDEVHLTPGPDDLLSVCPNLDEENAFGGILRVLARKRRTMGSK